MRVLLIDLGNTRLKWRIVDLASASVRIEREGALPSADAALLAAAWRMPEHLPVEAAFVSNVSSVDHEAAATSAIEQTWGSVPLHRVRSTARRCGVVNGYRDPGQLGPDRWLALIAARALAPGLSQIVCSFGTATTIDLLVADGDGADDAATFVGGSILPGIGLMRASLSAGTARLPSASGDTMDFATATGDAITSGIMAAQLGAIERAIRAARRRLQSLQRSHALGCTLAGGDAQRVASLLGDPGVPVRVAHDLVLSGLQLIAADQMSECSLAMTSKLGE